MMNFASDLLFEQGGGLLKIISLFVSLIFLAAPAMAEMPSTNNLKTLKIQWHRLVAAGQTCPRCGATEKEVEKACRNLEQSLAPLGIKVVLEKQELNPGTFQRDPSQSNRIWIDGRSLEEWLGLKVGQSPCCSTCGDAECRTVETEGQVYETIPADLIIKAGLVAASKLLNPQTVDSCCQKDAAIKSPTPTCCPK
jgi:hypothetical protein